jgi:6-phosphofructokinase
VDRIRDALEVHGIDGLIVIGGEGTLSAATALSSEEHGIPIVGVPKTIDNDLGGTDFTVGFATALDIATEAVDRLHSTAESHNRVMLLEVMGRHAGWIATLAGIAGGADAILIPEQPFDLDAVCRHLKRRHGTGPRLLDRRRRGGGGAGRGHVRAARPTTRTSSDGRSSAGSRTSSGPRSRSGPASTRG